MKCPVCKTAELNELNLEKNLLANGCENCGGRWISSTEYWNWLQQHDPSLPEQPFAEVDFQVDDTIKAKLCPDCGHILLKYKVGHGLDFFLDHCDNCNGIWLDQHEWEVLKVRNLHDELHRIFTTAWQKQVREEEIREKFEQFYAKKFGEADYAEIKRIREWLEQHSQRSALLAFLSDDNPYGVASRDMGR
jgi:Zn-finger nucleic acid-binding protein